MTKERPSRKDFYKEKLELFSREVHLIAAVHSSVAGRATIQLCNLTDKGSPRPVGTGVLFRAGTEVFILTAAHVTDEFMKQAAFVTYDGTLIRVTGHTHASRPPATMRREDDVFDFAVVRVDDRAAALLGPLAITIDDVWAPFPTVPLHKGYVLLGFPAATLKIRGPMFSCPQAAFESRRVSPQVYQNLQLDPENHIVLKWHNTSYTSKGLTHSRSMRGVSGGGVWLVPELVGQPFPRHQPFRAPKLMGIFTEHRKSRSVLISTNIKFHLDSIIEKYPALLLRRRNLGGRRDVEASPK